MTKYLLNLYQHLRTHNNNNSTKFNPFIRMLANNKEPITGQH